jgi:formylglycine-generating enzyme required for sulfatase activity
MPSTLPSIAERLLHVAAAAWSAARGVIRSGCRRLAASNSPALLAGTGFALGVGLGAVALLGLGGWFGPGLYLLAIGLATAAGWNVQPTLRGAPRPPVVAKRSAATPAPTKLDEAASDQSPSAQPSEPPCTRPTQPPPGPPSPSTPAADWPPPAPRFVDDLGGLLKMVELPSRPFEMGSPESDKDSFPNEKPQHRVMISAFAMARLPVTRKLYRKIVGQGAPKWSTYPDDDGLPANYIHWFEAVDFCNALSRHAGLRECYIRYGQTVERVPDCEGYRLPTEAEWEYAARAGTTTRWFFGDNSAALDRHAWFAGNAGGEVHAVGEKEANPWGLHDILGNTLEWCWDWYAAYPATGRLRLIRSAPRKVSRRRCAVALITTRPTTYVPLGGTRESPGPCTSTSASAVCVVGAASPP